MRDLYKNALETFADKKEVAFYVVSVIILGQYLCVLRLSLFSPSYCAAAFHMWHGWPKAVQKMSDIPKEYKRVAISVGHVLAVVVTVGFVSCPIYVHYVLLKGG